MMSLVDLNDADSAAQIGIVVATAHTISPANAVCLLTWRASQLALTGTADPFRSEDRHEDHREQRDDGTGPQRSRGAVAELVADERLVVDERAHDVGAGARTAVDHRVDEVEVGEAVDQLQEADGHHGVADERQADP